MKMELRRTREDDKRVREREKENSSKKKEEEERNERRRCGWRWDISTGEVADVGAIFLLVLRISPERVREWTSNQHQPNRECKREK